MQRLFKLRAYVATLEDITPHATVSLPSASTYACIYPNDIHTYIL